MEKVLKDLLEELGSGFLNQVETDYDAFSCCHNCGCASWDGHREDCSFSQALKAATKMLEVTA